MRRSVIAIAICLVLASTGVKAQKNEVVGRGLELDAQAHALYARGQYRQAYKLWQQALKLFKAEKYEMGISGATIQMALAQKYIGVPIQACKTLRQLMKFDYQLCEPDHQLESITVPDLPKTANYVVGAIALGNLFHDWGQVNAAETYFDYAIRTSEALGDTEKNILAKDAQAYLALNQLKLKRDRLKHLEIKRLNLQQVQETIAAFNETFGLYEEILDQGPDLDATIKWLTLYQEQNFWVSLFLGKVAKFPDRREQYKRFLRQLESLPFDPSPVHKSRQKLEISKVYQSACLAGSCSSNAPLLIKSILAAKDSIETASTIQNSFWQSYGYGQLGVLFKFASRDELATEAFKRAERHARLIKKPNPLYRWQFELGKLYEDAGEHDLALQYYDAAIQAIKKVEWKLTPLTREIRTDFQETVRPIFNKYMALALRQEELDYGKILATREQQKLSEIQNYLRCGSLDVIPTNQIVEKDSDAIYISIIYLDQIFHVISKVKDRYHHHSITDQNLYGEIDKMILLLESSSVVATSEAVLKSSLIKLHDALISPILPFLPEGATLLFDNDSNLQRIPMAILTDGSQYLVERFRIASIGEKLYEPKPLDANDLDVFFAGVSDYNPKFPQYEPLSGVEDEAKAIAALGKTKNLTNQKFTVRSFLANVSKNKIVHVATHGQFSSDPESTFLAAWDKELTVGELQDVVRSRVEQGLGPIELLVLSACQTAKGDRKASLGIAGFAIQAGARSTLASLWNSDDQATAVLMGYFYENLLKGESKVDALRNAQLKLLRDPQYANPYYWSNFILVGSWL